MAVAGSPAVGPQKALRSPAVGANVADMHVTVNGDADQVYDVVVVVRDGSASEQSMYLRFNDLTTNLHGNFIQVTSGNVVQGANDATVLFVGTCRSGRELHVTGKLICSTGGFRSFTGISVTSDSSDGSSVFCVGGFWKATTGNMVKVTVHSTGTSMGTGSSVTCAPPLSVSTWDAATN